MKKYEGIMKKYEENIKNNEGNVKKIWKKCLPPGGGGSYADADVDRIPEMASSTKREGGSPAQNIDKHNIWISIFLYSPGVNFGFLSTPPITLIPPLKKFFAVKKYVENMKKYVGNVKKYVGNMKKYGGKMKKYEEICGYYKEI